jgi:hypothetical protein
MTNYDAIGDWRIRINGNEHGMPHVHVHVLFKDGSRVSIAIDTREILAGSVSPTKRLADVFTDIAANKAKYLAEYRRLNP